jgi:4-amino-4-deoxy-L-arabinose transferase-like glycosyltransferase
MWIGMLVLTLLAVPYTRIIPFLEERDALAVFQSANTPNLQLDVLRHIHSTAGLSPAQRAVRDVLVKEEFAKINTTFADNMQAIRSSTDRINRAVSSISSTMTKVATLALALAYIALTFFPWALAKVIAFGWRPWRWHLSKGSLFQVAAVVPIVLAAYFASQTTVSDSEPLLWLLLAAATAVAGAHLNASTAAGSPIVFVAAKAGATYHYREDCPSIGRRSTTAINLSNLAGLPFAPCKRCSLTASNRPTTNNTA